MTRPAMSTRQASRKTADAAGQPLDWPEQQSGLPDGSGDGEAGSRRPANGNAQAPSPNPPMPLVPEEARRGFGDAPGQGHDGGRSLSRRTSRADDVARAAAPPRPAHTDRLHRRLLAAGPAGTLAALQAAA